MPIQLKPVELNQDGSRPYKWVVYRFRVEDLEVVPIKVLDDEDEARREAARLADKWFVGPVETFGFTDTEIWFESFGSYPAAEGE